MNNEHTSSAECISECSDVYVLASMVEVSRRSLGQHVGGTELPDRLDIWLTAFCQQHGLDHPSVRQDISKAQLPENLTAATTLRQLAHVNELLSDEYPDDASSKSLGIILADVIDEIGISFELVYGPSLRRSISSLPHSQQGIVR